MSGRRVTRRVTEYVLQHRGLSARRPSTAAVRPLAQPALVDEDQPPRVHAGQRRAEFLSPLPDVLAALLLGARDLLLPRQAQLLQGAREGHEAARGAEPLAQLVEPGIGLLADLSVQNGTRAGFGHRAMLAQRDARFLTRREEEAQAEDASVPVLERLRYTQVELAAARA